MDPDAPQPLEGEPGPPQPEAEVPEAAPEPPSGFPFTPRGVASFAQTGWGRLFAWQLVIAVTLGGSVLLVLGQHWAVVMDRAIQDHLPAQTGLRAGQLIWPDDQPQVFAHNRYLCVLVDPNAAADHGQLADVQIELRRGSWVCSSVFGEMEFDYLQCDLPLTREQFVPWWGSRRPFLLLGLGAAAGLAGWLGWLALGFLAIWPAKIIAYYSDRKRGFAQLWRMAAAAFLPASALLAMGVLCYALRLLPLMGLLVFFPLHLILGGGYLFLSSFYLPNLEASSENPFDEVSAPPDGDELESPGTEAANPFAVVNDEDG